MINPIEPRIRNILPELGRAEFPTTLVEVRISIFNLLWDAEKDKS